MRVASEFAVHEVVSGPEKTLVKGRCLSGIIIIGTVFDSIEKFGVFEQSNEAPLSSPINAKVLRIVIYGRIVSEITEGLTAELQVEGSPLPKLDDGDVLHVSSA